MAKRRNLNQDEDPREEELREEDQEDNVEEDEEPRKQRRRKEEVEYEEEEEFEEESSTPWSRIIRVGGILTIVFLAIILLMSMCRSCAAPPDVSEEMRLDSLEQAMQKQNDPSYEAIDEPVSKPELPEWVLLTDGQRSRKFSYKNGNLRERLSDDRTVTIEGDFTVSRTEEGQILSITIGSAEYVDPSEIAIPEKKTSEETEEPSSKSEPSCVWTWYTIQRGETLNSIAAQYGMSAKQLAQFEGNQSRVGYNGYLVAGRKIKVPCLE